MGRQKIIFLISFFVLAITLFAFLHFLTFNENRLGYSFNDPVLNLFQPIDISWVTFITTYSFAIAGIIIAGRSLELFTKLIQLYTLMTLLRMLCLYVLPLEPPRDIIPLHDIFLRSSFYSGRDNLKDLFFSGHAATMFLFAFLFSNTILKIVFTLGGIAVGVMVMLQHVHYSIDVLAAPLIVFGVVKVHRLISSATNC